MSPNDYSNQGTEDPSTDHALLSTKDLNPNIFQKITLKCKSKLDQRYQSIQKWKNAYVAQVSIDWGNLAIVIALTVILVPLIIWLFFKFRNHHFKATGPSDAKMEMQDT